MCLSSKTSKQAAFKVGVIMHTGSTVQIEEAQIAQKHFCVLLHVHKAHEVVDVKKSNRTVKL